MMNKEYMMNFMKKAILTTALLAVSSPANARILANIETSGLLVKNTLEVHAFDDPTLRGVTCYVTLPKRTLSFEDQSNTSISCRKVGEIGGRFFRAEKKIFKSKKSWFIKSLFIDRVYDAKNKALVYISYTEKFSGDNASNSISVVPIP